MNAKQLCLIIIIVFTAVIIGLYQNSYGAHESAQGTPFAATNLSNDMLQPSSAGQWIHLTTPTTANLTSVIGGAAYSFAVGDNGTLLHYDGLEWYLVPTPTTVPLAGIWGQSPERVFIVGAAGNILQIDGDNIAKMPFVTSANLHAVWGFSPADAFAVGDNGTILHFDGDAWTREPSGTASPLRGVGASKRGDVFSVGDNGTILRRGAGAWSLMSTPTTLRLNAVWVFDSGEAVAVGAGIVLHYDGDAWRLIDTPTTANLNGVWGISAAQIYAVGDNGTVIEFNGDQWTLSHANTALRLTAVHNGFAVGQHGDIFQNPSLFLEAANLRITELDPWSAQVEVSNFGPPFTTGELPFCHRANCTASIPAGTVFGAGGIHVFPVAHMNRSDTDLWLYRMMPFSDPSNLIHGVKYGPLPNVGHTDIAVEAKKWPGMTDFAPAPFFGASLAFDGHGSDPKDWYIDETPSFGRPDHTPAGTVDRSLYFPVGTQDFEAVLLGDEVFAIADWKINDDSVIPGIFTARVVDDVMGVVDPRGESTRWLRIRDQNEADLRNEVASPMIAAPYEPDYQWTFWVNFEEQPRGDGAYPAMMAQHASVESGAILPVWGIEFRTDRWYLVVTRFGGNAGETALAMPAPRLGSWYFIQMIADFQFDRVRILIDGATVGELPINLDDEANPHLYRLAYQGDGRGNTATFLLDDVSIESLPILLPFFKTVNAEVVGGDAALSWSVRGDEPVEGFAIYRRTNDSPEEIVAGPLPADARRYDDQGLETGTAYRYVIGALKPDATTIRSRAVSVTIDAIPAVVFGELRTRARDGAVEISWDIQINEPIEGFRIYRRSGVVAKEIDVAGPGLLPQDVRRFEDVDVSSGAWYDYRIVAVTVNGAELRSGSTTVQVPSPPLEISQVFPNPFRNSASLEFTIPDAGRVIVSVFDVRGKLVARLYDGTRPAGTHAVTWNGRDGNGNRVSAGTYFFKLEAPEVNSTRKAVLVR